MGAKVYVVQVPMRYNRELERVAPFMDMTSASIYGDIQEPLLDRYLAQALSPGPMLRELERRLVDYRAEDYLLMVGDPVAIAAAALVAAKRAGGILQVLKWNKETNSYIAVKLNVWSRR